MEKTIWTPGFSKGYDFKVYLDVGFAKEMMQSKIPYEMQSGLNKLGNDELKQFGVNWLIPYQFYKDSCFITQFDLGQNGVWLSVNNQTICDLLKEDKSQKIIEYHSHNVEYPKDAFVPLVLFSKWVEYKDILKQRIQ